MKEFLELEAATVEEALERALERLGLRGEEVEVEVLRASRRRLLGLLSSRPARIRVEYDPETAHLTRARSFLQGLLTRLGLEAGIRTGERMGSLQELRIEGPDAVEIVREDGELLAALERITNRAIGDGRRRYRLDVEGFRAAQNERLQSLAEELAHKIASGEEEAKGPPLPVEELRELRRLLHGRRPRLQARIVRRRGQGYLSVRKSSERPPSQRRSRRRRRGPRQRPKTES